VGSIPTRLTLEQAALARRILEVLRGRQRSLRLCRQSVSKGSRIFRSDARYGVAQIIQREVPVGAGRRHHRRVPQDALHAVRIDASLSMSVAAVWRPRAGAMGTTSACPPLVVSWS
jgi:hypothetical protein